MRLLVQFEGCNPKCTWAAEYPAATPVVTVVTHLSQHCGLSAYTTQLWRADLMLKHSQLLQEVHADGKGGLQLKAVFILTMRFYMWYSFSWVHTLDDHEAVAALWRYSAEACASLYWACLPQVLLVQPAQELPLAALQYSGHPHIHQDCAASMACLDPELLVFLSAIKRLKLDLCSLSCLNADARLAVTQWKQLVQPSNIGKASALPSKHMNALRGALLVLKLAGLTNSIKGTAHIGRTLWLTLDLISGGFQSGHLVHSLRVAHLNAPNGKSPSDADLDFISDQEQLLSWQLTERTMPLLCQPVGPDSLQAVAGCRALVRLLQTAAQPVQQGVVSRIIAADGISVLASALGRDWYLAVSAYGLLDCMLMHLAADEVAKIKAQLAGMHAVHSLSALLCPPFQEQQEACHVKLFSHWATFAHESKTISAKSDQAATVFPGVVSLMIRLLARQPFWPTAAGPGQASETNTTHAQHRGTSGSSNDNQHNSTVAATLGGAAAEQQTSILSNDATRDSAGAGHVHDNPFGAVQSWPTPTAAAWSDTQTIAARAWLLLEWLVDQQAAAHSDGSQSHRLDNALLHQLAALLHKLLAGHVLDLKLDMQMVCASGTLAVLLACMKHGLANQHMNDLGWLLLKRMATDATLMSCSKSDDPGGHVHAREVHLVALLGTCFFGPQQPASESPAAAVTAVALYAALACEQHCCHLTQNGTKMAALRGALHRLEGSTAVQLTIAACWARIASVELAGSCVKEGAPAQVYQQSSLDVVLECLSQASLAPLPWSASHCAALGRVFLRVAYLIDAAPSQDISVQILECPEWFLHVIIYNKQNGEYIPTPVQRVQRRAECMQRLLNLLQHWREAVPVPGISNWLLMGAVRLVDALKPAELSAAHADGAEAVQGFGTILMDLLTDRIQEPGIMSDTDPHLITYSSDVTFQSVMCLPSTLLKLLSQAQLSSEDKHRFAQHVFLPCAENLIADSRHCLDQLCVRGTAAALLTMPKANICMLERGLQMLSIQDVLTFPLKEAAVASLQYVFLLLDRITCFYKPDSVERKSDPGGFSRIEHQFALMTQSLEGMREQQGWAAIFAAMERDEWCKTCPAAKDRLETVLHYLSSRVPTTCVSSDIVNTIQSCFAVGQGNSQALAIYTAPARAAALQELMVASEERQAQQEQAAWASADAAAAELMAEEQQAQAQQERAAAKAAARKAKKQKENAAKEPPQRQQPPNVVLQSITTPAAVKSVHELSRVGKVKQKSSSTAQRLAGTELPSKQQQPRQPAKDAPKQAPVTQAAASDAIQASWAGHKRQLLDAASPSRPAANSDGGMAADTALSRRPAAIGDDSLAAGAALTSRPVMSSHGDMPVDANSQKNCPIAKAMFVDPVIAADGHTYERAGMVHWLQHSHDSPVTGQALLHCRLVPNVSVQRLVALQRLQEQ